MLYPLLANVAIAEPEDGLAEKLKVAEAENRPLRVKLGFDPTAPDLHLGHAVVLQKLRDFQLAGHTIVVIIGDFTASIGDPTGRNKLRPPLSDAEIRENAETYLAQLGKVVDIDRVEVRRNSEWHGALSAADILRLMAKVTVAQVMTRDDFRRRFADGLPIHLHELLYPILQGYDSVMIDADIELGGTDQLFNNLMGRHLQETLGKPGQAVITMPLLVGTDGSDKMSKSKANYVGLTDAPEDMFGKLMSISDAMLPNYIDLTGSFADDERRAMRSSLEAGENPMVIKKRLAENVRHLLRGGVLAMDEAAQPDPREGRMRGEGGGSEAQGPEPEDRRRRIGPAQPDRGGDQHRAGESPRLAQERLRPRPRTDGMGQENGPPQRRRDIQNAPRLDGPRVVGPVPVRGEAEGRHVHRHGAPALRRQRLAGLAPEARPGGGAVEEEDRRRIRLAPFEDVDRAERGFHEPPAGRRIGFGVPRLAQEGQRGHQHQSDRECGDDQEKGETGARDEPHGERLARRPARRDGRPAKKDPGRSPGQVQQGGAAS